MSCILRLSSTTNTSLIHNSLSSSHPTHSPHGHDQTMLLQPVIVRYVWHWLLSEVVFLRLSSSPTSTNISLMHARPSSSHTKIYTASLCNRPGHGGTAAAAAAAAANRGCVDIKLIGWDTCPRVVLTLPRPILTLMQSLHHYPMTLTLVGTKIRKNIFIKLFTMQIHCTTLKSIRT